MATKDKDELSAAEQAALKEAKKAHGVSEAELALLSDDERAAIEETDDDDEHLREIAAEGEEGAGDDKGKKKVAERPGPVDDDDDAGTETAEDKAAREKQEAKAASAAAATKAAEMKAAERAEELADMSDEDRAEAEAADKATAEAAKAAAKEAAEAGEDDEHELDVPVRPRMPRLAVKPVEKYDEQMAALDTEYDTLLKTYKEGDVPIEDLLSKQRALDNKRYDLREAKSNADRAADHNKQIGQAEWMGDVQDFFGVVKEKEGIDYTKRAMNVAFDDALKTLAADEKNADKSEVWYLREAHKMVKADLGLVAKKADADDKGNGKDKDGKKVEGRKPKIALVHDLGKIPNASDGDGEDNAAGDPEFAALDRLSGQDYEDALARMSESKQDKYLRATR
jgi:hypothetical protein